MSLTAREVIEKVRQELLGLEDNFEPQDYDNAVASAQAETGWTIPVATGFKELCIIDRIKRHLIYMLFFSNAEKFRVKDYLLQQRFEHYQTLLRLMDNTYERWKTQHPTDFASVDAFRIFGTKVDAGFSYDEVGRDTTYSSDNIVKHKPDESD